MDDTAAIDLQPSEGVPEAPALVACPDCETPLPPSAKFCPECGARLPAAPSTEVRKLVTLLFCDLVGSTALGEKLDPETFRRVQLRYYATCEAALHRHRGTIEKFIGDAVLCVFGIPIAHEDDAQRACRAALDLVAGVEALNVELDAEWGVRLAVRIGVNTGTVVAGELSQGQQAVTGDAVNTAARLEQAAGAGEILIGATTRELIGDEAVCAPVQPLELKGKEALVPAWRLVDMDVEVALGAARARAYPLVGRDVELTQIEAWLAQRAEAAGACLLLGPPGIGKSRLLLEVAGRATRQVFWGRCPPYGEEITYRVLADWLDAVGDDDVERAVGRELYEQLLFATGRSAGPSATTREIRYATERLFSALSRRHELLLIAEDVHWAERPLLDLIEAVAAVPGVAVVATARPDVFETHASFAAGSTDARFSLRPIASEDAGKLLELAGYDRSSTERVVLDAEGNPLLLLQLALHLGEGGDPEQLPPGLEAVLQARVERLSPAERSVAERGAVMGREFWDSALAALGPDAPAPETALGLLMRRSFVVEGRADGAPDVVSPTLSRVFAAASRPYSFTHALLRDAVYEATPKLRRADLHQRLGEILERASAADELIAFHFERAARLRAELRPQDEDDIAARAAEHLERAGERALAREDGEAARALLTRAAALVDDGSPARERLEASLAMSETGSARTDLVPGDVIGGYLVRAVAGRGGMGVVYRAEDLALGREVALKVIAPTLAGDPRFRERFARETRIAAGLEHPNVVPVYGAGEENGRLFIAMRFVEGADLQSVLRDGRLPPDRAAGIVSQVAAALDAAHVRGLVHRDVKPANVLITKVGRAEQAYLTDFGLTRNEAAGDGLTKTGQWVGTLAYVAPEQIRGEPVDARADIYALGAVLYECLTGHPPFEVRSELEALAAHLDQPPPRPSAEGVPKSFDSVVERAMNKDPRRRFRSAGDLARAAGGVVDGRRPRLDERSVATGAAAPIDVGRRKRRSQRTLAVAAAIVAALAALAVGLSAWAIASRSDGVTNAAGRVVGETIALPTDPDHLAAADGRVWAIAEGGGSLVRVAADSGSVDELPSGIDLGGGDYADLAATQSAVWIARAIPDLGGVDHVDATTGEAVQHIPLALAAAVAADPTGVWAVAPSEAGGSGRLVHVDPATDRILASMEVGRDPSDVAIGDDVVWVANRGDDSVWRVDARTRAVQTKTSVGDGPAALAVTDEAVWVANMSARTLMRIDPGTSRVEGAPISLGKEIQDLVASRDSVWVASADGTVTRLDAGTGAVIGSPLTPANAPLALAFDGDLWVGSSSDQTLTRIEEG